MAGQLFVWSVMKGTGCLSGIYFVIKNSGLMKNAEIFTIIWAEAFSPGSGSDLGCKMKTESKLNTQIEKKTEGSKLLKSKSIHRAWLKRLSGIKMCFDPTTCRVINWRHVTEFSVIFEDFCFDYRSKGVLIIVEDLETY